MPSSKITRIDLLVKELSDEDLSNILKQTDICECREVLCKYCAVNKEVKLRSNKKKLSKRWGQKETEKFFRK
jgi:hypothetical protein